MPNKNIKKRPGRGSRAMADAAETLRTAKVAEARRVHRTKAARDIESTFSKLSPAQLEQLGLDAYYARLPRPVPASNAVFDPSQRLGTEWEQYERAQAARKAGRAAKNASNNAQGEEAQEDASAAALPEGDNGSASSTTKVKAPKPLLTLPKRPRWNRDMNKKALESNEAEVFRSWLQQTDDIVAKHSASLLPSAEHEVDWADQTTRNQVDPAKAKIPSQFERNLSVFAQLWRVSERSDILCVLLDARCPLLHLPPSLIDFLRAKAGRRTLLVLTKADLVPRSIAEAWRTWLLEQFGEWTDVVITESYRDLGAREGQGSRSMRTSFMSPDSRQALIASLQRIHAQLVQPPPRLRTPSNDNETEAIWTPPCVEHVDWEVFDRLDKHTGQSSQPAGQPEAENPSSDNDFFTIGLIGQPNVGKSSMLNAILGSKLVRASKTPGKTKAFQTHFVGQAQGLARPPTSSTSSSGPIPARIRLCDSPGLVFPSLVGMEMQVLGAILPISQVQAISSCVRFAAAHMPLEEALGLPLHEPPPDPGAAAKGKAAAAAAEESHNDAAQREQMEWTAVKILEHVAARFGFRTAKANRWDTNRAGNWVMRALAEGRIPWAFRPPALGVTSSTAPDLSTGTSQELGGGGSSSSTSKLDELDIEALLKHGHGIWLGGVHDDDHVGGDESTEDDERSDGDDDEHDGPTEHESLRLSQSLTATSINEETDDGSRQEDIMSASSSPPPPPSASRPLAATGRGPIKINFRRAGAAAQPSSLHLSAASTDRDNDGDDDASIRAFTAGGGAAAAGKRKGKGSKKTAAAPVLSKRARLREEGLALLAAKAEAMELAGSSSSSAAAAGKARHGAAGLGSDGGDEDESTSDEEDRGVTSSERSSALGGSVFLAAAAAEQSDGEESEEHDPDSGTSRSGQ
ncbi:hypothetical protein V8E36_007142 [Tilletia maclaganii]